MQRKPTSTLSSERQPAWLTQSRSDGYIRIRIHRNMLIAGAVSLFVHGLLLLFLIHQHLLDQNTSSPFPQGPLVVNMRHLAPPHVEAPALPEPPPPIEPPRHLPAAKPKPRNLPVPQRITPPVMTAKEAPKVPPTPTVPALPSPPKPPVLDPSQFSDMASYVKAMRAQRHGAGEDGASQDEVQMANLKRTQPSGTNGVFQLLSMDTHSARITFLGWKGEFSYSRRETYEVNANIGEDIHRAIVRKMIEIIRRYYDGDFNWDSPRLGRVVVLSARLQDNDGLEDFLLEEFFVARGLQY